MLKYFSSKNSLLLLLFCAVLLSSCAVGPDYVAPDLSPETPFGEGKGDDYSEAELDVEWWKSFQDEKLDSLIARAAAGNKDVGQALARINEARALAREAFSHLLPGMQVTSSYEKSKVSGARFPTDVENDEDTGFDYELYSGGIDALWEIDIFGGLRRGVEASNAEYGASVAELQDVLRMVVAEVGTTYFALRGAQLQKRIAEKNIALQGDTLNIVQAKFDAGVVSELDLSRAIAQSEQTKATVPVLNASVKTNIHRLATLLGKEPKALESELIEPQDIPLYAGPIKIGNPAELLRRRPDLRVAERKLAAETARVGVAVADLFPKLTLEGTLGVEAPTVSDLTNGAGTYMFGPRLVWTPLDSGRLMARVKAADARTEAALYAYEGAVLLALEDVESSLVNFSAERMRRANLVRAVAASEKAYEIAREQYELGVLDFLSVVETQRTLLISAETLARSEQNLAVDIVSIYKALGGGWQAWELADRE